MPPKLIALIIKELLQAFSDPRTRIAFIIPPLMQVFLYAYAATLEVTNAPIGVYNEDWGQYSRQLISRFERASAFSTVTVFKSGREIQPAIDSQSVLAVIRIPQDFSRKVADRQPVNVQVLLDGRRSNSAQILNGYISSIVANFAADAVLGEARPELSAVLDRTWFNPNRDYRNTMVPALVGTLTMTTVLMVMVMSVSRERELGTFEQLLVSPLQPYEIIIGKAVPGLIIGLGLGASITIIIKLLFGIPITGSLFVLFTGLFVFMLAIIGVGLFISSLVATQQQAMLGAMVYMMPAMMLSGFMSPVQNMPDWLQPVALINPLTHFLVIVRGVFLRDMPMALVAERIWPMLIFAVVTLGAAAWLFQRKAA